MSAGINKEIELTLVLPLSKIRKRSLPQEWGYLPLLIRREFQRWTKMPEDDPKEEGGVGCDSICGDDNND